MNTIVGPLGVQVLPPELVSEGQFGQRLTPMTIRVGGKSAYSDAVAALAGIPQVIELQQQLQQGLFDTQQCKQLAGLLQPFPEINALYNAVGVAAPILAAVVVNALAGGGSVDFQVGGVRTGIDDTLVSSAHLFAPFLRSALWRSDAALGRRRIWSCFSIYGAGRHHGPVRRRRRVDTLRHHIAGGPARMLVRPRAAGGCRRLSAVRRPSRRRRDPAPPSRRPRPDGDAMTNRVSPTWR